MKLENEVEETSHFFSLTFTKMTKHPFYKILLLLVGIVIHPFVYISYKKNKKTNKYIEEYTNYKNTLLAQGRYDNLLEKYREQEQKKAVFFNEEKDASKIHNLAKQKADAKLDQEIMEHLQAKGIVEPSYLSYFGEKLQSKVFIAITFVPAILMYVLLLLTANPFVRFVLERVLQSFIVIIGVATLVFTLLYLSPFDPARNLLGESATVEQVANFNKIHGLDQPYLVQLWESLKGLITLDLGNSFAGKEDIMHSLLTKFPVTLEITIFALLMAIAIAIPVGIISAVRPNSYIDYTFMFIALLGLSIPSFWQGLIFILTFALKLQWLPATYIPNNTLSLIMPVVVLGTSLTASIARMTRSSMLEVINEDYITTAKAKGLSEYKVIVKHAIRNAMIPVITVIGLLFGGMLGGSAVTEKVFNISGIGSYIVDKQFIPDIPAILGGVVYVAVVISLINMIIDILYAFFDPRIRSNMKKS